MLVIISYIFAYIMQWSLQDCGHCMLSWPKLPTFIWMLSVLQISHHDEESLHKSKSNKGVKTNKHINWDKL